VKERERKGKISGYDVKRGRKRKWL